MLKIILTAMITFVATSIDEIPVFFMLYAKNVGKGKSKIITLAYFIGTFLLITLGLFGAFGLMQIPVKWVIGLTGLLPLGMGIKVLIKGDDDEEKAVATAHKHKTLWLQVLVITLALGADDLGVYIPLFTTLAGWEFLLMLLVFTIGTAILCFVSYRLTKIDQLMRFLEKQEHFIVGIVFIGIGIFVMFDCGTFSEIIELLNKVFF